MKKKEIQSLEEELLRFKGKLAENCEFPITITVESQKIGKEVYKTNACILTVVNKKDAISIRAAEKCNEFNYFKCVAQHIGLIGEILKDAEPTVRYLVISMLKDILKKYKF